MYQIKRNESEIDKVLDKVNDNISEGNSEYPGMSYEDGIQAFWMWLNGATSEHPFDE